MLSKIEIIVGR